MNSKQNVSQNVANKWTILVIILITTFMATLDGSIVNVALPKMARTLDVTTSGVQFVSTSYLIAIAGVILIFGKLGDMIGKNRMFILGVILFTIGSLLCGLSNSFTMLIISRIIQAVGAAGTMANNQGIIAEVFPVSERGKALGLIGTAVALGALVGPGLGGLIVGLVGWEYIFYINVPIGLLVVVLSLKLLPRHKKEIRGTLDYAGAVLFILSIVPLFLALNEGVSRGFTDAFVLAGFVMAVVFFVAFLYVEHRKKEPLVDLNIFHNKLFSLSIFCGFITFTAIFCHNIILPFYLQDLREYTPTFSGMIMMVYPLVMMVVAPLSGHLSDKIGSEFLTFVGLMLTSAGLYLMVTVDGESSLLWLTVVIAIMSAGNGMFQSPNNSLIMSTVSRDKLGVAGSINGLIRQMGMICGIALATTLLYGMMSMKLGTHVTDYIPGAEGAFVYGMHAVYLVAGSISLFGALLTLFRMLASKKEK